MKIGVINETSENEKRAGLTPGLVHSLVSEGHSVFVEKDAGMASFFKNSEYVNAGGELSDSKEEVFSESDCIVKVGTITLAEAKFLKEQQVVFSFLHLAAQSKELLDILLEKEITTIGFDVIEEDNGVLPVVETMSDIAGRMTVQIAAHLLESKSMGMGILLSGVPGVAPANVMIIGAGILGTIAARSFADLGADVMLLDSKIEKLRLAERIFQGKIKTILSTPYNIQKKIEYCDVFVGAIFVPGDKTPVVINKKHVKSMKPGSVIMDLSIDQGGCVETSRPTTLSDPYYILDKVTHYCVPNVTSNVPRTATRALANVSRDYIFKVANNGIERCIEKYSGLRRGIYTHVGAVTNKNIGKIFGYDTMKLIVNDY